MNQEFYLSQMTRLQTRFGERAFDPEFVQLAWEEVKSMSEIGFKRSVETWIGSRPPHLPPLIAEFREARLAELKSSLRNDAVIAIRALTTHGGKSLKEILSPHFGSVSGALDAIKVARHRLRREDKQQ